MIVKVTGDERSAASSTTLSLDRATSCGAGTLYHVVRGALIDFLKVSSREPRPEMRAIRQKRHGNPDAASMRYWAPSIDLARRRAAAPSSARHYQALAGVRGENRDVK